MTAHTTPSALSVTIDVSAVPYGRGVSRYTSNLVAHLAHLPGLELQAVGYSRGLYRPLQQWLHTLPDSVSTKAWPLSPAFVEQLWRTIRRPSPVSAKTAVFHAWEWQLPPLTIPQVVTIHDLAYQLFPETAHPTVVKHFDRLLKQIEKNPLIHVIAVSQTTRDDVLRLTGIEAHRVHVVYEALPQESQIVPSEAVLQATAAEFPRPFLLFVGTTEPRKNLQQLIAAWKTIRRDFDLVIAGSVGWDEFTVQPGMHVLGYVPDEKLAALYRLAQALMYPSLYEGFGLPILEAYFHGCPVITSNRSSMAEIAGKPAILVNPEDPDAIAEATLTLESRDSRARRQRQKDMQRVLTEFSWEKAAQQTFAVYQQAARPSDQGAERV